MGTASEISRDNISKTAPTAGDGFTVTYQRRSGGDIDHSVVIPCHYEPAVGQVLEALLQGVTDTTRLQIITAINGEAPSDERERTLPAVLEFMEKFPNIDVTVLESDKGQVGYARNGGAKFAEGKVLTFVDGDTLVPRHFLDKSARFCAENNVDIASAYNIPLDRRVCPPISAVTTRRQAMEVEMHRFFQWIAQYTPASFARPMAAGAFITMKRSTFFERTDGFQELPLGEDFMFAQVCVESGMKFRMIPRKLGVIGIDARRLLRAQDEGEEALQNLTNAYTKGFASYLRTGKIIDPNTLGITYDFGGFGPYTRK